MNPKHLHEMIDACRPGHEDVDRPEFSELAGELSQDPSLRRVFQRSQELDGAIRTVFQTVTPPPGLVERLLAASETPTSERDEARPAVTEAESPVKLAARSSRRSIGIWAGVASLATVVAVITLWFQWPQPISSTSDRDIAEIVDRWNARLDLEEANWQTAAKVPSQDFPTWQHLDLDRVGRWQWVTKRRIACYDFSSEAGIVRLFVEKPAAPVALPPSPPLGYPLSNGWQVGAWQANGRVYYLAVYADGDSKRLYSRVIASPFNAA